MDDLVSNVTGEIIADALLFIAGVGVPVLLILLFRYRSRKKLFDFFGISKRSPEFLLYLSTVFVTLWGSMDFRGERRSFNGPAIPADELSVVPPVANLFSDSVLDNLPVKIRDWLGKLHWSFQPVSPTVMNSPRDPGQVRDGNTLIVGSRYYNSAGERYRNACNPILEMVQDGPSMVIRVNRGRRTGEVFRQRRGRGDDLAIVERLYDEATETTIFIAAGLDVVGTKGAVHYIVRNWRYLSDEFGKNHFALCLRFESVHEDSRAHLRPIELSRFRMR